MPCSYCLLLIAAVAALLCPAVARGGERTLRVGDDRLQVTLSWEDGTLRETAYLLGGARSLSLESLAWSAETDDGEVVPGGAELLSPARPQAAPVQRAAFRGRCGPVAWHMDYAVTGPGRITRSLTLTAERGCVVRRVAMWDAASVVTPVIARTSLQDIVAFYRDGGQGLFVSLDFPYSRIQEAGSRARVTYPPHERLARGASLACHSLTCGVTTLTGRRRQGFDDGEVEAMDAYIQERFRPRFNRPLLVSACINNRYTQLEGDWVFYTMRDHPTLTFHTDLMKRELALMRRLGIEYYQVFPGMFDWVPGDPDPQVVRELVATARRLGVRIGDYSTASGLYCAHYNEHRNSLDKPEWHLVNADGTLGPFSLGVPEYVDYYASNVARNCREYGFQLHCLDFLAMAPDHSTKRPYPPGDDSVYQQVKGLVRLLETINAVSPQMMTWSNAGNWAELLPKLAWYNPNLYLTDPFISTPWQGLNMTRLLDDARREQMVSLHYSRFLPYRFYTNCQYFFSQNSVVPDIRNYQYGALSTLAVTPNLCLGEIRPWLDTLPQRDADAVVAFYRKWTRLVAQNYALWTNTYSVGEDPRPGAVEVYGHARGKHGFVFLVNPQYWDRTVEVPLDGLLGFSGEGECEIAELHPVERLRLTAHGPFARLGTRIRFRVPAQQVVALEVRPAPATIAAPRLYGLPGTIEPHGDGYLVKTSAPQGTTEHWAVVLPPGSRPIGAVAVRKDVPKQPARQWADTLVSIAASSEQGVLLDITFRRAAAPTEVRQWRVAPGSLQAGLQAGWTADVGQGDDTAFPLFADAEEAAPTLPMTDGRMAELGLRPLARFCGAYIDNAFSEEQETWIELRPGASEPPAGGALAAVEPTVARGSLPNLARDDGKQWWLQTHFRVPFMWWAGGSQPPPAEHTLLVLPLLRPDPGTQVKAWLNGEPLEVRAYRYPRNPALFCFYADLVGTAARGGENTLVVHYEAP